MSLLSLRDTLIASGQKAVVSFAFPIYAFLALTGKRALNHAGEGEDPPIAEAADSVCRGCRNADAHRRAGVFLGPGRAPGPGRGPDRRARPEAARRQGHVLVPSRH